MATWGGSHTVDNFEQIEFSVGVETSEVLEYVMENVVLPKLQDYIYRDVYRYTGEQSSKFWGGRTGQFLNAWKVRVQKQGFYNNVILYIDDNEIDSFDGDNESAHRFYEARDLAEVINKGWKSKYYDAPPCGFPVMRKRPYWNDFIHWMNDNFADEFLTECNRRGLNMTITGDLDFSKSLDF